LATIRAVKSAADLGRKSFRSGLAICFLIS